MSIDIKHMLKVYNYINDDKRPKFNYKFLGLFAGFLVATGALIAFAAFNYGSSPSTVDRSVNGNDGAAADTQTDYVGLSPAEAAAGTAASNLVQSRLDSWYAAHPGANVHEVQAVYEDGRLIGYLITYEAT